METVWFFCSNPLAFTEAMLFAKWLMLRTIPFSVEYDRSKIGFTGHCMEKEQMEYWKSA